MDVDESFESTVEDIKFKCNVCASELENKDSLMKHKKTSHIQNVPVCEKFSKSCCQRSDSQCWYKHIQVEEIRQPKHQMRDENPKPEQKRSPAKQQVFQEVSENPPPDLLMEKMMESMNKLYMKVESMEKRFQELMN